MHITKTNIIMQADDTCYTRITFDTTTGQQVGYINLEALALGKTTPVLTPQELDRMNPIMVYPRKPCS